MNNEILVKKEVSPIVKIAKNIEIIDVKTMKTATEVLSNLNKHLDMITEVKEKVTKPLNEALKAERGRWKPIEVELQEAIDDIRGKMSEYQTEEIKREREEEAKIASRIGEGKGKIKMDTAARKMDEIEKVEGSVSTEAGSIRFREDKILKITDVGKIPEKYWILDESAILDDLKEGKVVEGAVLDIKMVPINTR